MVALKFRTLTASSEKREQCNNSIRIRTNIRKQLKLKYNKLHVSIHALLTARHREAFDLLCRAIKLHT